jgi:hypothetical protein
MMASREKKVGKGSRPATAGEFRRFGYGNLPKREVDMGWNLKCRIAYETKAVNKKREAAFPGGKWARGSVFFIGRLTLPILGSRSISLLKSNRF